MLNTKWSLRLKPASPLNSKPLCLLFARIFLLRLFFNYSVNS